MSPLLTDCLQPTLVDRTYTSTCEKRILHERCLPSTLYFQSLLTGHVAIKAKLASHFTVTPRVIQRDFSQLRDFITAENLDYQLIYSRRLNGYQLKGTQNTVTKQSILLLIKILLASRSLTTIEMHRTITSLLSLSAPEDQREIYPIIKNESFY